MSPFPADIVEQATLLLEHCRAARLKIATAESCTGGLIAACLTEISGASDVFDRGFVTYSNDAKQDMLGVKAETLQNFGAVSKETALEMASGARSLSGTAIAIAVTGIAGPGGGSAEKPVGLVHIAVAGPFLRVNHHECRFGNIGRSAIRVEMMRQALRLAVDILQTGGQ